MSVNVSDLLILAQQGGGEATQQTLAWYQMWYGLLAILIAIIFLSIFLGQSLAKWLRMRDYAWKIGLVVFVSLSAAAVISLGEFKGGIDLAGGTILVYEIDQEKKSEVLKRAGDLGELMKKMVTAISQRIDPAGVKQVTIRRYGNEQIEIIIPKVTQEEVKLIKNKISTAGNLEFRILADREMDPDVVARAEKSEDQYVRDKDAPASKSDDGHAYWIDEAKRVAEKEIKRDGRIRAVWEVVPDEDVEKIKKDPDLVTQTNDDGQLEVLKIIGQARAQWVQVGEIQADLPDQPPQYRVQAGPETPKRLREDGTQEMLVVIDDFHVDGSYLTRSSPGYREGRVCVDFSFNGRGAKKFGALTGANIRESGRKKRLGIILDEVLLSAPSLNTVIRESGQITGDFTEEEVDWLVGVLNAGSLPAALDRTPISQQEVSPTLGEATIKSGSLAIGISLLAVLAFMPLYYRFAGFVACFALLLNLLLVLGVMVAIGAAFTLPGLAGLVLTVGMAVDANVLIFERIREERDRGAALRMAIRNGFGRATRTIVDANLTTLITAVVLYVIGTDQIKGFAVTLILGIGMSMFTAIFCSRIIFDIAEKRKWITELKMIRLLGKTDIDFLGKARIAGAISVLLIAVGLVAVTSRGTDLFAIDFRGGSRVEVPFTQPTEDRVVREKLVAYSREQPLENKLNDLKVVSTGEGNTQFVIETTQDKLQDVEDAIKTVFEGQLKTNTLQYDSAQIRAIPKAGLTDETTPDGATQDTGQQTTPEDGQKSESTSGEDDGPKSGADPDGDKKETTKSAPAPEDSSRRSDLPPASLLALADDANVGEPGPSEATDAKADLGVEPAGDDTAKTEEADPPEAQPPAAPEDPAPPATKDPSPPAVPTDPSAPAAPEDTPDSPEAEKETEVKTPGDDQGKDGATGTAPDTGTETGGPEEPKKRSTRFAGGTEVDLQFADKINRETLRSLIAGLLEELKLGSPDFEVFNPNVVGDSAKRETDWTLRSTLSAEETEKLLSTFRSHLEEEPVFASATNIGGQVAGDTQTQALSALIASLVFIIAYIWIRFQRVTYGLAAVVALVHDVLVTLGVIAMSYYIADIKAIALPLKLEAFKISLPVLAAFLTIIGYSLNDTIVVFDRIREVRGKSPHLTHDIVNKSINQTLSRTLLTSVTTLIVVLILYFIGGPGIHGFAFALVIGVLVGTYSSIFVASPALLWMSRIGAATDGEGIVTRPTTGAPAAG